MTVEEMRMAKKEYETSRATFKYVDDEYNRYWQYLSSNFYYISKSAESILNNIDEFNEKVQKMKDSPASTYLNLQFEHLDKLGHYLSEIRPVIEELKQVDSEEDE